jgi:glycosyltransferase involved in cell wall biosynthesis
MVKTKPNIYIEDESYISVKPDWSDLKEKTNKVLGNFNNYSYIANNFRERFKKEYSLENLCLHWYNIFNDLDNVRKES